MCECHCRSSPCPPMALECSINSEGVICMARAGIGDNEYCHPVTILMMIKIAAGERVSSQAK